MITCKVNKVTSEERRASERNVSDSFQRRISPEVSVGDVEEFLLHEGTRRELGIGNEAERRNEHRV